MYVPFSKMSLHVALPNDCFNFLIAETDSNHSLSLLIEAITVFFFPKVFSDQCIRLNLCSSCWYPLYEMLQNGITVC